MTHNDYKEMIPARALSALDAADDRVLTDHLASCDECRHELDDWQTTAAGLAFEAPALEPSARVKQKILTQVRELKVEVKTSNVVQFAQPRKTVWSSFGSLGAIAAAILFVGVLVYAGLLWKENRALQSQLQSLVAENKRVSDDLSLQKDLISIIFAPGAKMSELSSTPQAPGAIAKLAYDKT